MKCLALGPGAMGFFIEIGVLAKMTELGRLEDLEEISGSSAGALLGFLFLATRGDIAKVLDFSLKVPVNQIMKPNLKSLLTCYGLIPQTKIKTFIQEIPRTFMDGITDVTFAELYEWNKIKLNISSFCVDLQKTTYFSVDTTPHISVIDAICGSIAVPFLISTVKINKMIYIDGGIEEDTPCACFIGRPREDVQVIRFAMQQSPIKDIKSYILNILNSILKMRYKYTEFPVIELDCSVMTEAFDFGATTESKLKMYMIGHSQQII
jgi:NTE family protein